MVVRLSLVVRGTSSVSAETSIFGFRAHLEDDVGQGPVLGLVERDIFLLPAVESLRRDCDRIRTRLNAGKIEEALAVRDGVARHAGGLVFQGNLRASDDGLRRVIDGTGQRSAPNLGKQQWLRYQENKCHHRDDNESHPQPVRTTLFFWVYCSHLFLHRPRGLAVPLPRAKNFGSIRHEARNPRSTKTATFA